MFDRFKPHKEVNGLGVKRCPNCGEFPKIRIYPYSDSGGALCEAVASCDCIEAESVYSHQYRQEAIPDCIKEWNALVDELEGKSDE